MVLALMNKQLPGHADSLPLGIGIAHITSGQEAPCLMMRLIIRISKMGSLNECTFPNKQATTDLMDTASRMSHAASASRGLFYVFGPTFSHVHSWSWPLILSRALKV